MTHAEEERLMLLDKSSLTCAEAEKLCPGIFENLSNVLGVTESEVDDIHALSQGLTNVSLHVNADGDEYVYRHPGIGTDKFINRIAETQANEAAHELGIDRTFVCEDSKHGWKVCRFVPNAKNLDPNDPAQVKRAMELCRSFHESDAVIGSTFDFFENGVGYERLLASHGPIQIDGYDELREKVVRLNAYSTRDGYGLCFSHNDYLPLNFLFDEDDTVNVIDWEFAGMSDPGNDFGTFVICSEYDRAQAEAALAFYFDGHPTFEQRRHFWSRVVLGGWCWYVWALEKEAEGAGVGEWLDIYRSYAVDYIDEVLSWYEKAN